ncbi:hypothetical protein IV203_034308 [Nitzschia inconspicua]|uniref:Uncharacterized protein n=1 Tax=Nitzschia inconspicua TaxID=303405 RepID=A0A9K3M499_9STRA|nr:hypothetical protein IV203_034308 [Nitzschia inconspicua]
MALLLLRRIRPYGVGSSSSCSSSSTRRYNYYCYRGFGGGFCFFLLTLTATISIGYLSIRTYQQIQQVVHKTRSLAPQLQFNVHPTIPHSSLHTLVPSSSSSSTTTTTTFHVLFTLLGRPDDNNNNDNNNNNNNNKKNQRKGSSAQALYNSWQVSLKSVLLNAPTDRPMQIHVMCNSHAQRTLHTILHQQTHLSQSKWRNPITISTYNVEGFHPIWKTYLRQHLKSDQLDDRVSLGGYYRLLAHFILPLPKVFEYNTSSSTKTTKTNTNLPPDSVLYMDSDVVILSNLNEIIPHLQVGNTVDEVVVVVVPTNNATTATTSNTNSAANSTVIATTILFQGSKKWFCSGFIGLNIKDFDVFWNLLDSIQEPLPWVGDQSIFDWVLQHYPDVVAQFPPQWDRNLGHGWRPKPQLLLQEPDAAGMVHFQGGAGRPAHLTYFDSAANSYIHNNNNNNYSDGVGGVGGDVVTDFAQYCTRSKQCRNNAEENIPIVESTWGLAKYYVQVPWHWVLYFGKSLIDPNRDGYPLQYEAWTAIPPTAMNNNNNNNNNNTHNNENDPSNNSHRIDDDINVMYPNGRLVPFTVRSKPLKKNASFEEEPMTI